MAELGLTLAMIVKNEATFLPACLQSVAAVVDEMVIVDTGSTDDTVAIAKRFGAQVIEIAWPNDFAAARNVGLDAVKTPWVLVLDGDEELVRDDVVTLREEILNPRADAYNLRIVSVMDRAEDISESYVTRLFRSHPAIRFRGVIHEQVYQAVAEARMRLNALNVRLVHKGYLGSVVQARNKEERNRTLIEAHLTQHPDDAYMLWQLAQTHTNGGRFDEAIGAARRALKASGTQDPLWVLVMMTLARAHLAMGHPMKAIRVLAEGKAAHPRYTDFWYLEGIAWFNLKEMVRAEQCFHKCLEIGEAQGFLMTETGVGGFKALFRIAQVKAATGAGKEAVAYLLMTISSQPQHRSAWRSLLGLMQGQSFAAVVDALELKLPLGKIVATLETWPNLDENERRLLEAAREKREAATVSRPG